MIKLGYASVMGKDFLESQHLFYKTSIINEAIDALDAPDACLTGWVK